jgi:hypothetical protein
LSISLFLACGKKPVDSDKYSTPTEDSVYFEEYMHLNTSAYNVIGWSSGYTLKKYEWAIDGERSLGEPFTDVNGNGEYDPGIDEFIISWDTDLNQDLNHDSRYTYWYEPWTEGVPFDDLDGDSIYDWPAGDYKYKPGFPFCDYNNNGVCDSMLDYNGVVSKLYWLYNLNDDTVYAYKNPQTEIYTYISDSNQIYSFPNIMLNYPLNSFSFIVNKDGLMLRDVNCLVPILGRGSIIPETGEDISILKGSSQIYFMRDIKINQELVIDNIKYDSLLFISYDRHPDAQYSFHYYYKFYLDRTIGLLLFSYRNETDSSSFIFLSRYDSIPIPMTK